MVSHVFIQCINSSVFIDLQKQFSNHEKLNIIKKIIAFLYHSNLKESVIYYLFTLNSLVAQNTHRLFRTEYKTEKSPLFFSLKNQDTKKMKISILAISFVLAEEKVVESQFSQLEMIRNQVEWIIDNHLVCETKGIKIETIRERMSERIDNMKQFYARCMQKSNRGNRKNDSGHRGQTSGKRRKRANLENLAAVRPSTSAVNDRRKQFSLDRTSAENAIAQFLPNDSILEKWVQKFENLYPCNMKNKEHTNKKYAGFFARYASTFMSRKLRECQKQPNA
jgi:hypothetical protein